MITPINKGNLSALNNNAEKTQKLESQGQLQKQNSGLQSQRGDRVELSSQVKLFKSLEQEVKKMPEFDQSKVDRIKQAISDGEYSINHERLANAILAADNEGKW